MKQRSVATILRLTLLGLVIAQPMRVRADKPAEIRIAVPGTGIGNRPQTGGDPVSTANLRGLMEEEFKKDGIKVTWTFLRGAGPAVNELYANGLADFSPLGDLPFIVGQASGLKRRILAADYIRGNTYLAVPADSNLQSLKDLKGKKVAYQKGTNIQTVIAALLEANGLSEKEIRSINMDGATARAALVTKDIDAHFGGSELLALRDQGVVKIVYASKGDPRYLRHGFFIGNEEFIKKYPEITQRVVNVVVQAAKWSSDLEKTPTTLFQLWTKSGVQFANYREDFAGRSLRVMESPLVDPYLVSQVKGKIKDAKRFGLIREVFDLDALLELRFLEQALKQNGLENYWPRVPESGDVPKS